MPTEILSVQPGDLKFPFELRRQISCSLQLLNTTENYVAFKVKTTSPKKYCVRPNTGIVLPHGSCDVTVTMQAQREAPPDLQCKDKFLVQSVIAQEDAEQKNVSLDLFSKESGKEVFETKLRVVYVSPPQPPSPVPESAEEGVSPRSSSVWNNGDRSVGDFEKDVSDLTTRLAETRSQIARLSEDKKATLQKAQQLQEEITMMKAKSGGRSMTVLQPKSASGFSFLFVLAVALLGIIVGYMLHA